MSVTVKLSPLLRKYVPGYDNDEGIVLENGAGQKLGRIIEKLPIPEERITMIMVNHHPSRIGYETRDGDQILLGMVIGGG